MHICQSTHSSSTTKLQSRLWGLGLFYWVSSFLHRSFVYLADGHLSTSELMHLCTIAILWIGWLYLKPEADSEAEDISTLKYYELDSVVPPYEGYLHETKARMRQLKKYHLISQAHVVPVPYLCQIYHLLNLKHLESIHGFSLNGLKIVSVDHFETTENGGAIKFQTALDSPLNVLRIWRQPTVEVELILHTPYTVELSIPIYSGKKITVMFNVLPLGPNEHKLFIDIYSNVVFPRLILQILLHFASSLTLLEDLPYLHKLAKGKIRRLAKADRSAHYKTTQLFERFAELYGPSLEQSQPTGAIELRSA